MKKYIKASNGAFISFEKKAKKTFRPVTASESIALDKSEVTDYSDQIDWSEASCIYFTVYQFDQDDKFDGEGEAIKEYSCRDAAEFFDAQSEAVEYADSVAKKEFTPMTVVMVGYNEDGESLDDYWDTIYYVTPYKEV